MLGRLILRRTVLGLNTEMANSAIAKLIAWEESKQAK